MKKNKEAIQMVCDHLDQMHKQSEEITTAYNSKYIPLPLLRTVLDKSKMKPNKVLGNFPKEFNNTLESLFNAATNYCNEHKLSKNYPLDVFKLHINIIKKNL